MIRQGVSFYSYQNAYRSGRMTMEDMVAEVAALGCDGVELVPVMTPPCSYPKALPEEIDAWYELMARYNTRPVCLDSIIVTDPAWLRGPAGPNVHLGAALDEQVRLMKDELLLCRQLGFPIMRVPVLYGISIDAIEQVVPVAEEYGIKMGLEVHVPMTIKGERVQRYLEMVDRTGTKNAGLIPDMAIFATTLPVRLVNKVLQEGADPEIVDRIVRSYENKADMEALGEELRNGIFQSSEAAAKCEELLAFGIRNVTSSIADLEEVLDKVIHFHAKFYDVDENLIEHGIRFDEVVPMLVRKGYDGYLNSEYEGQRMYPAGEEANEIEQVRRQHWMVDALIKGA